MSTTTKLELYERAHRDGSLGTQELDPLDVLVMVDSGHFDYMTLGDSVCHNDIMITHEGRRELCRMREEIETGGMVRIGSECIDGGPISLQELSDIEPISPDTFQTEPEPEPETP